MIRSLKASLLGGLMGALAIQGALAQDATKIKFWTAPFANLSEDQIGELVKTFNAEHPAIQVELSMLTFADSRTKIKQAVSAGTGPDVFTMSPLDADYITSGSVAALTDVGYSADELASFGSLIASSEFEGKSYAVPMAWNADLLFVNTTILNTYGFDAPPTTWDELLTIASTVTTKSKEAGKPVCGFQIKGMDDHLNAINHSWAAMLTGAGGSYMSDDLSKSTQNTPEGKAALTYLKSFFDQGVCTPGISAEKGFRAGEVAIYAFSGSQASAIAKSNLADEWVVTLMPTGPGGASSYVFPSPYIAVNAKAASLEAAGTFMKWLTSPANTVAFMETGGATPYQLDTLSDDLKAKVEAFRASNPMWTPLFEAIALADPSEVRKDSIATQQRWTAQAQNIVAAINGQMSIDDALAQIDRAVDESLE